VGSRAHFFLQQGAFLLKTDKIIEEIKAVVEPIVQSQGMELVDLEYQREGRGWVLRVFLDREGGITVENCAEASGEIGATLEVKDFIPNPYILEVSSPGLDRPLKKPEDFIKYQNHQIKLKTFEPIEGRKNFKGLLLGMETGKVRLEVESRVYEIPLQAISKANLEFEF
jgi:ribosome maturation factor RimP